MFRSHFGPYPRTRVSDGRFLTTSSMRCTRKPTEGSRVNRGTALTNRGGRGFDTPFTTTITTGRCSGHITSRRTMIQGITVINERSCRSLNTSWTVSLWTTSIGEEEVLAAMVWITRFTLWTLRCFNVTPSTKDGR